MQFKFLAPLALAGSAVAAFSNSTDVTVTEVVTAYTTYCPAPTEITQNGQVYTVTEATTLTITNCPCTITHVPTTAAPAPSSAPDVESTFTNGAANLGVAGLAAAAGAAVYLL